MQKNNNELIVYKENIVIKFIKILKGLFRKKDIEINEKKEENKKENKFVETIRVSDLKKKEKLFEEYQTGEICENELSIEQIIFLKKVYKKKIKNFKIQLEYLNKTVNKKILKHNK